MTDPSDHAAARRYLAPLPVSSWRWDEAGQVIEWTDGTTIAFRQELEEILRRLAPRGLPPFHALLMLLAACHDSWCEVSEHLLAQLGLAASVSRSSPPDWLPEILGRLDTVRALPADLRHDLTARALLAELVFEDSPRLVRPDDASQVVRGLSGLSDPALLAAQSSTPRPFVLQHELRPLYEGLAKVDAETLRLRRQTGLDALIRPAEVDVMPADHIRRLISALRDDAELGGVARVAGQLLAAIHLPRPIADHEDLPVGGMSDIANRGPLDRLLISELAQDDLTLAVRVAMNEALYLRRESPPRNPPQRRAVLIDAGIRVWGVPRVFATAVAMAIAATADRNTTVDVYRAQGKSVVPVDLTSRNGLVQHLGALEPDAHTGDALAPFCEAVGAKDSAADLVVITGEDVVADPAFRRAIEVLVAESLLLATVTRDGRFRMVACGRKSRKTVSEARLNLEELLAPRRAPTAPLVDKRRPSDLPAILGVKPFPLLLSYQPVAKHRHWVTPNGYVLGISHTRCLMQWHPHASAARMLAEDMPSGRIQWATTSGRISKVVVEQFQQKNLWLLKIDIEAGICESLPLECRPEPLRHVCGHGEMVFLVYDGWVDMFDTELGRLRQSLPMKTWPMRWYHRFFAAETPANGWSWNALSYDGVTARCEPVFAERDSPAARDHYYLAFVDVEGHDGPIGIREDGRLYDPARDKTFGLELDGRPYVNSVSRNGRFVNLWQSFTSSAGVLFPSGAGVLIELPSGEARTYRGEGLPDELVIRNLRPVPLRTRFRGAFVNHAGRLVLVGRSGSQLELTFNRVCHQIEFSFIAGDPRANAQFKRFIHLRPQPTRGYTLKVAAWDDGSRIYLDSRGMLHLKSSDVAIPELTMVLFERELAGWCADGRLWGASRFTGTDSGADPEAIYTGVLEPFLERLR